MLQQEWEAALSRGAAAARGWLLGSACHAEPGHTSVHSQNFEKMLGNVKSEQL